MRQKRMAFDHLSQQMLGQYELRELLGVGGMGAVYRAYQASLKREVAVKVLPSALASQAGYAERFIREAETAAALEHPHIVPIVDYGTVRGTSYIVMRLLTGGTIASRLAARPDQPPSLGEIAEILKDLASALDYAHGLGVIHRDLKPTNVMFDNQGNAYLVDFGIAKLLGGMGPTKTGMTMGTPSYMAPEQWRNEELGPAADQYALGVMTYQLVTGRVPFEATTPYALMHKHLHELPTPAQALRTNVPEAVTTVLHRAMAKDARQRFPSVTAFAQAFEAAIAGHAGQATKFLTFRLPAQAFKGAGTPSRPSPVLSSTGSSLTVDLVKRNPLILGIVGLIVLLVIAAVLLLGRGEEASPDLVSEAQTLMAQQTAVAFIGQVTGTAESVIQLTATSTASTDEGSQAEAAVVTPAPEESATSAPAILRVLDTETPTIEPSVTLEPLVMGMLITETASPIPSETARATAAPTETAPATETRTFTPASSATLVPVIRILDTDTPVPSPTDTATVTATATPSPTTEPSITPDLDATLAVLLELTRAAAGTLTQAAVPTATLSATPDIAATLDALATATEAIVRTREALDATATATYWTATPSATWTPSQTSTMTPTVTPSPSATPSPTITPSTTATPSSTPSAQPTSLPETLPTFEVITLQAVVVIGNNTINLRSAPNANSALVTTAGPGQQFVVEQVSAGAGSSSTWYQVRLEDGRTAWVRGDLVRLEEVVRVNWTPVERDFNGVTMVLVPAGCFLMGSDDGDPDERPVHEQCFDEPFWMDKTEVTQAQFARLGGRQANWREFSGDDRPVENITWFEARGFCERRGGRLPTEAEWEYAARGPENRVYPWGDTWNGNNVVWRRSSLQGTANVGSIAAGASWVGALDLSGNVREWTSSLYEPYPYDAQDGRERNTGGSTDVLRVLRGGSWDYFNSDSLRAPNRLRFDPDLWLNDLGFRCARSFDASEQIVAPAAITLLPTETPEPPKETFAAVVSNTDWVAVERDFSGVTMVLVPPGCFLMGSNDGDDDERPVHELCFSEPFWIGKTEVTQAQFASFGGSKARTNTFSGGSRPVERISWFEAQNFCGLRGERLPTEAEWEYAARGPSNWVYPWGSNFSGSNVAYEAIQTENVGTRLQGASWVGALDMSGNVWEWTSSLYFDYPYNANDGRERDTGRSTDVLRVLRGGSFLSVPDGLRVSNRFRSNPGVGFNSSFGFRCMRPFE